MVHSSRSARRSCLRFVILASLSSCCLIIVSTVRAAPRPPALLTRNVILVTTDGLRWQEVFTGAEEALMDGTNGGVKDVKALRDQFWRSTPNLRRRALMPF